MGKFINESQMLHYKYQHMIKHLKQYNNNHGTSLPIISIKELKELGLVDKLIISYNKDVNKKISRTPSFLLLHKHLPYVISNIFAGTIYERDQHLISLPDKYCGSGDHMVDKSKFKKDKSKYDGLSSMCNDCIQRSHRTKEGLLRRMYNKQVHSSKQRGHKPPEYDRIWLTKWAIEQPNFQVIFDRWVKSGYDKDYTPSIDRKDNYIGYTKDNIQLMTWKENNDKGSSKTIHRYNVDGIDHKIFYSIWEAKKSVKGTSAINYHIDRISADGKPSLYKGFVWKTTGNIKEHNEKE